MSYELGFAKGELDALADRRAGIPLDPEFKPAKSPFEAGYRDGYTPRSPGWWQVPAKRAEPHV